MRPKLIVILGPTASGKTDLSLKLAKKFNGEIVSADSRQIYRGMDIGTGKITKKEMRGVPHYLLNAASPKKRFSVTDYKTLAEKAIKKIQNKNSPPHQSATGRSGSGGKIPFLVGGTGFYIQAVVDNLQIPKVKPDWKLRKQLGKKPVSELFAILNKKDPRRAKAIDKNNPRRLIRALEIVLKTKQPIPLLSDSKPVFDALFLGVKKNNNELKKLIKKRLLKRLKQGMAEEVKKLRKSGVSWKRLEEFGLEYRYIALYLQNKIGYSQMIEGLQKEIEHYAKRQMTWFKRDKRIKWVRNYSQAENLVKNFLKK